MTTFALSRPGTSRARRRGHARAGAMLLAVVASMPLTDAWAVDATWTFTGSGSWGTASNWRGGVPQLNGLTLIRHTDSISRDVVLNVSTPKLLTMQLDNSGSGLNSILHNANITLSSISEVIGGQASGKGKYVQSTGTNSMSSSLSVGQSGGEGTYVLSGGTVAIASPPNGNAFLYVGRMGIGTFLQSDGTVIVGTQGATNTQIQMWVGGSSTGTAVGFYDQSGGTLSVFGYEYIGLSQIGTFNQTAGLNSGSFVSVGVTSTGVGTYLLSGSGILQTQDLQVGPDGHGTFNQSGGAVTTTTLAVSGAGGQGQYLISNGTLNVGAEGIGTGGSGAGTFDQSGGTHTIAGNLVIAYGGGGGTYLLSGGTLNASTVINKGFFSQSGGVAAVAGLGNFDSANPSSVVGSVSVSAGSLTANQIQQDRLSISGTGSVTITAKTTANDPAGTSFVKSLSINSGALDLTNNSLIIDYSSLNSLLTEVRQHIQSSRLTSSSSDAAHRLGYADNAQLEYSHFGGLFVDSTTVLIKYTYAGDANVDGRVDVADLFALALNYNTANVWQCGDFNYDGNVTLIDLQMLARNWGAGTDGSPLGPQLAPMLASLGLPAVEAPEPTNLAALALAAWSLKRPRRQY